MILSNFQKQLRKTTVDGVAEAVREERGVADTIEGVEVFVKYEGSCGRGSVSVYSGVFLNGERWATEIEYFPWSIFKDPSTTYRAGDYMSLATAKRSIKQAGVSKFVEPVEEPYPSDDGVLRYGFACSTLEAVVLLFKTVKANELK